MWQSSLYLLRSQARCFYRHQQTPRTTPALMSELVGSGPGLRMRSSMSGSSTRMQHHFFFFFFFLLLTQPDWNTGGKQKETRKRTKHRGCRDDVLMCWEQLNRPEVLASALQLGIEKCVFGWGGAAQEQLQTNRR